MDTWYKELKPEDVDDVHRKVFSTALEFAFAGVVEIAGKNLNKWSLVRTALKIQATKLFQEKAGGDAIDVGSSLLAVLQEEDSQSPVGDIDDPQSLYETLEQAHQDGCFDDLKEFNGSWGGPDQLERHPRFNDMMRQIWSIDKNVDMSVATFVSAFTRHVGCYISHDWIWFTWQVESLMQKHSYLFPAMPFAQPLQSPARILDLRKARFDLVKHVSLQMLGPMGITVKNEDGTSITYDDVSEMFSKIDKDTLKAAIKHDASAPTIRAWEGLWRDIYNQYR